ncbi:unnamed protein product [Protopolystoma xenopodis]|uniref:Uncharacterized protein n=1 Tax=Protopolystoma xenopodis TaxID=117903 RepID=A0A3S4ZZM4_9PLAT|nr:unnamed protein product [Protopolystoma xenopodis]
MCIIENPIYTCDIWRSCEKTASPSAREYSSCHVRNESKPASGSFGALHQSRLPGHSKLTLERSATAPFYPGLRSFRLFQGEFPYQLNFFHSATHNLPTGTALAPALLISLFLFPNPAHAPSLATSTDAFFLIGSP